MLAASTATAVLLPLLCLHHQQTLHLASALLQ
jgi:hypothetical protein